MPIFCNLDNGMAAVVKYPKNRFGNEVLFNELVSAEIAKSIDLPIPDFGICYLPLDVIQAAQIEELSSENSGKCFYSKRIMNSSAISAGQLLNASIFP